MINNLLSLLSLNSSNYALYGGGGEILSISVNPLNYDILSVVVLERVLGLRLSDDMLFGFMKYTEVHRENEQYSSQTHTHTILNNIRLKIG